MSLRDVKMSLGKHYVTQGHFCLNCLVFLDAQASQDEMIVTD